MNAVLVAVLVMLALAVMRLHVVVALLIGALVGGLLGGLGLATTLKSFEAGIQGGASIALSYALLGAFAVAIAHSGLPQALASALTGRAASGQGRRTVSWLLIGGLLVMSILSQNLIPIHIAFIPLVVPPLLLVANRLRIDRRLIACVLTFGLVTTYMYLPYGFGEIFLKKILLGNIDKAGLDVGGINVMAAMGIPALGMVVGLVIAVFVSYRKPRDYEEREIDADPVAHQVSRYRLVVGLSALVLSFVVQLWADSLLIGALVGFSFFVLTGVVRWKDADSLFNKGIQLMAMIGFIMIAAQGFAQVMKDTGHVDLLVSASLDLLGGSKPLAAAIMLIVGLVVTMGIGSSFSTLPIIATVYVPLCVSLGFSPLATVSIVGTAGALGDAGSPASDSTLGPTSGLNADGQHDHMRDSVIPTFLHYNLPLLAAGWVAAMVL
ncbi:MAG: Na+/H+ antiporter NhaC family protein [Propionibacteriaceae bacterium]|nr:Na+/H+ antiporter NhaC family protein [Propionibacteriaceae bacterium]